MSVARSQEERNPGPFTEAFRLLHGYAGSPAPRDVERRTGVSATTIEGWLKEGRAPRTEKVAVGVLNLLLHSPKRGNIPSEMRELDFYLERLRQQKSLRPPPRTVSQDAKPTTAVTTPLAGVEPAPPAAPEAEPPPDTPQRPRRRTLAVAIVLALLLTGGVWGAVQFLPAGGDDDKATPPKDPSARGATEPLTFVSDAPGWECGDAVVVPRSVGTAGLAPGPRPADGVSASDTGVGFTVQGVEGRTVTLLGLTVDVVSKKDPLQGTRVPAVCQGDPPNRNLAVNLDERTPRVVKADAREGDGGSASDTGWPYTVSGSDPEHFVLTPTSLDHDVTFTLLLQWASNGKRGHLRVDDQGRPFRTTAVRRAIPLCLNSTTTRLLPAPDGEPCAS